MINWFYKSKSGSLTSTEMIKWFARLVKEYPIISIEDALDEEDWEGWRKLTEQLGDRVQLGRCGVPG